MQKKQQTNLLKYIIKHFNILIISYYTVLTNNKKAVLSQRWLRDAPCI